MTTIQRARKNTHSGSLGPFPTDTSLLVLTRACNIRTDLATSALIDPYLSGLSLSYSRFIFLSCLCLIKLLICNCCLHMCIVLFFQFVLKLFHSHFTEHTLISVVCNHTALFGKVHKYLLKWSYIFLASRPSILASEGVTLSSKNHPCKRSALAYRGCVDI